MHGTYPLFEMIVSSNEIDNIIIDISCNMYPGLDGLTSEHMKFANSKLPVLLSIPTYVRCPNPWSCTEIGDKIGNSSDYKRITDNDNYMPNCLSNVFTKVIENVLLCRMQGWLLTTSNQFGLKHKHGTDMCVCTLKELIRYYIKHGWRMYVAHSMLRKHSTG